MKKIHSIQRKDLINFHLEMTELAAKISEAVDQLNALTAQFNEHAGNAKGVIENIVSDIEDFTDSKSDKWHKSDKGAAYQEWHDRWEELGNDIDNEIDEVEIDTGLMTEAINALNPENLPFEVD